MCACVSAWLFTHSESGSSTHCRVCALVGVSQPSSLLVFLNLTVVEATSIMPPPSTDLASQHASCYRATAATVVCHVCGHMDTRFKSSCFRCQCKFHEVGCGTSVVDHLFGISYYCQQCQPHIRTHIDYMNQAREHDRVVIAVTDPMFTHCMFCAKDPFDSCPSGFCAQCTPTPAATSSEEQVKLVSDDPDSIVIALAPGTTDAQAPLECQGRGLVHGHGKGDDNCS